MGVKKNKVYDLISFANVPTQIWDSVTNMSKVSCRSASTINALSKKGENYISALIEISDDIRKGAGSKRIESMVNEIVHGEKLLKTARQIFAKDGTLIGKWKKNSIVFDSGFNLDPERIENMLSNALI